ncbi:nicotinate-nucleotide pyrophosphorylase (carboxylating) [Flavobacteriales bacterium]|nr:putative nicotinate-nucleotide pyrophosphorylase [carboxylating] [Flavobacteriales bacterium]MCL4816916.1 carboxylating nicotinate-nucleotide diphosphorylase [Flavobacteriales bacterium]WKZ75974.1 MAG: carboxylating nicotinate-nucleotide diphosphorylase [Vicingaceae bacterium]GIK70414.1 MAG: nicotinate-nucleotide diphosphorylase (carboxylating) [Bacteroidota bacterium]CAG0981495.1 nicotinate-nucleotide pyrophosphorylase (carboxylating) [Flavobacteriales bacterium]
MNLKEFITLALQEDIGNGDHTTLACIPENTTQKAKLLAKEQGIIAGVELAKNIFNQFDDTLQFKVNIPDGTPVHKGEIVFTVTGKARSILTTERLVLNCMQRMSGIATYTAKLNKLIEGTGAQLLDTRKTTPCFRYFEKWAVKIGGGQNHRFGLFDMIMIKDNHIDYAGSITQAVNAAVNYLKEKKLSLKIVVEARNIDEVKEILTLHSVHRILLDNFTPEEMAKAVNLINKKMETEASGGITEENIVSYAKTGVNFISVGALTHQIKSLDLSLKAF